MIPTLDIDSLRQGIGILNLTFCACCADSAIVILEDCQHSSGTQLAVKGSFKNSFLIQWESMTNKRGYEDLEVAAEWGGYGVTLLLIESLTDLTPISRDAKGNGIDIWLGKKDDLSQDEFNFLDPTKVARLEVSGTKNSTLTKPRLLLKKKQVKKSHTTLLPVYIFIIDFQTPYALTYYQDEFDQ